MAVSVNGSHPDATGAALRITVDEQGPETTIAFVGEWSLADEQPTRIALRRALARQPHALVVDLGRVTFIDSTCVHVLVDVAQRTSRLSIGLTIVPGPRAVQRVFEICQLTHWLPFRRQPVRSGWGGEIT